MDLFVEECGIVENRIFVVEIADFHFIESGGKRNVKTIGQGFEMQLLSVPPRKSDDPCNRGQFFFKTELIFEPMRIGFSREMFSHSVYPQIIWHKPGSPHLDLRIKSKGA